MTSAAAAAVRERAGVAGRGEIVSRTSGDAVDWAVRSGQLLRIHPRTLIVPDAVNDWRARCAAALEWAGEGSALSHRSALRVWGLEDRIAPADGSAEPIEVLVAHGRRPRSALVSNAVIHRSRRPASTGLREGLWVVSLERAIVQSWPTATGAAQRAPVITAVRERRTTVARVRRELIDHPRLRGRRQLRELLALIELGCHSELELWGHLEVFDGPGFAHLQRQVRSRYDGRSVWFDLWDAETRVDIELDGRRYHSGVHDWEHDIVRDALVAERGGLTLRFSHDRLTRDPAGCRAQALRVMGVRRRQLGAPLPAVA